MSDARTLQELLSGGSALTVVCHNNPDPDCLASGLALGRIAAAAGIDERQIVYSGSISHQQNRAFVNLLDLDVQPFEPEMVSDRAPDELVAFVDHSTPGVNNEVPEGTRIDVVIDHHPAEEIEAQFVDHREGVGATATILAGYVRELTIDVDDRLATALLFAIRRETLGFLRGVTRAEYEAAGFLHDHVDHALHRRLASPSVTGATIDTIAEAIENRRILGSVLISGVGITRERDALPQSADYLATLEGVTIAIVFGIIGDEIQLSARSTDDRIHIGEVMRRAFDGVGSAGGHQEMAGGVIPLGIFAGSLTDDERLVAIVEEAIATRLIVELNLMQTDEEDDEE